MRITCTASPRGPIYRLYRSDNLFVTEMRSLIPFLHDSECDVAVGGDEDDPDAVLIVGPLNETIDEAFRKRVKRHLQP